MPAFAPIRPTRTAVVFAGSLLALSAPALSAADVPEGGDDAPLTRGAELFATMCADCHGERGEGVEDLYDSPLHGDLSVGQLAEVIAKTMPEGDPESVVGEDAKLVAQYAHDVFYSRTAQLRNAPPRVELSRLTEGQYRRTIADLGAAFTGYRAPGDERGLNVEYKSRTGPWQKRLAFKRIEPQLDLFLGGELPQPNDGDETGPANGKLEEEGFQIDWDGALLPPVTGEYTIVVEASNQMYLTVNGEELVNAKVRSGEQTRYEVDVFLIAGRPTPIRVQMEKRLGKRFDKDPRKYDFFGKLSWIVPHRAETVIPTRALLPGWTPRTLLVSTPFPPDDRSIGYERGSSVSAAWDEATTEAAFEVVESLLESDGSISDFLRIRTKDSFEEKTKKAREFCAKWTERAFRRPLTDEQRAAYVDAHFVDGRHWQECVQRSVLMTLKSPYFLYPNLHAAIAAANGEEPDSY
ncbi:MAG: PA14 domain-containing protein, partial [Planctomycetota bacterium]